jgi:uncharacterized protein (TIGR02996 family)
MSNGDTLRAAIRADPTDVTVRLVFADWLDENDRPGGDLIRVLVGAPFVGAAMWQVVEWFHHRHSWPVPESRIARYWLLEVLQPQWWPDPDRLRECALSIAERMRPVAERDPTRHDDSRRIIEAAALLDREGLDCARLISNAAASVAGRCLSGIGDSAGDRANIECCEQVHLVAWTWLNLPPLLPVGPVEPPEPPEPLERPALPAPPPDPPRPWWRRLFGG